MEQLAAIAVYPEVQDGAPVFKGTRIRIETFYDFMRLGVSVDDFLDEFPSVTPEQAYEVLPLARRNVSLDELKSLASSPETQNRVPGYFERGIRRGGR